MQRRFIFIIFLIFTASLLYAQEDSLLKLIPKSTEKQKADIYRQLTDLTLFDSGNKAKDYAEKSIQFARLSKDQWCEAYSLRLLGIYYDIHGDFKIALEKINKALEINREIKDDGGISACLSSLGIINFNQGRYDKALELYLEVLPYFDANKQAYNKSLTVSNIAAIYKYQKEIDKAIEYYRMAYQLMLKSGSRKGLGISSNNIGMAFYSANQIDSALFYMEQGLAIKREFNDQRTISYSLSNLSQIYDYLGKHEKAMKYLDECVKIQEEMEDKKGMANSKVALGDMLSNHNGDDEKIIKNYTEAYQMAKEMDDLYLLQLSSYKSALAYYKVKKYQEAAEYMYAYTGYKDSLYSEEKAKSFAEMQTKFDTEKKEKEIAILNQKNAKKELELSIANNERLKREKDLELISKEKEVKEALLLKANSDKEAEQKQNEILKKDQLLQAERLKKEEAEKEKLNEQNKKKEQQIYAFAIGLFLLLGLLFFVIRSYSQKRKANLLLASQNEEIKKQQKEIILQSEIIEEKNKDVMSSIVYAKRLQDAILPSRQLFHSYFSQSFILYKPKDIVAGDFYFIEKMNDLIIVAAADCTGHGVPGAMVSVVCSNALNSAVKEFKLTDPGKILDKVREMVNETFKTSESEVKDGMDISLAVYDSKNKILKWSGANNPLWYVEKDALGGFTSNEMKIIKPDKQPIGQSDNPLPFTTHIIEVKDGLHFYLFTDGYADQFGGEKGKKFKYSSMQELILQNINEAPQTQNTKLETVFEDWKGDLEQVDDVCIIGVRL